MPLSRRTRSTTQGACNLPLVCVWIVNARRYERRRGGPPNPGAAMNEHGRITTPWRKKSQQIPNMLRCRYDLALYGDMHVMDVKPKMAAEICRTSFWERETRV